MVSLKWQLVKKLYYTDNYYNTEHSSYLLVL